MPGFTTAAIGFLSANAAVIGAGAAVVGAGAAVYGSVESNKAQKKALAAQRKQQADQRRRSARMAAREAQILRARQQQGAVSAGAFGSGAQGGSGSIQSNLGSALGFSARQSSLSGIISNQNQRASTMDTVSNLGATLFNTAGGFGALGFGSNGVSTPDTLAQ